jgi:hypothetical protein
LTTGKFCLDHSGVCGKVESIQKEIDLRFVALDRAIASTKEDLNIRLRAMNEFRAQLDRQANTFVPRSEIFLMNKGLEKKVDLLLTRSSERVGSTKWTDRLFQAIMVVATALAVWAITGQFSIHSTCGVDTGGSALSSLRSMRSFCGGQ